MWLHCLLITQFSLTPLILEVCPLFRQDYLITTLSNRPFLSLSFSHLWPLTPYQLGSYPMFSKEHLKWIARERTRSTWVSLCPSPWALSANVWSAAYGPSMPLDIILGCRSLRGKTHGGNIWGVIIKLPLEIPCIERLIISRQLIGVWLLLI